MRVCSRCLYSNAHPLHLTFDEDGICSGCQVHEEKDKLDWAARGEQLRKIFDGYRNTTGNNYDCVIPVSGARDSFFIVHTVKKVYGLNPLLVTYNKQYNTAVGVRNLATLRTAFDCDIVTLTVNPDIIKKITRSTFRRFGSVYWHCLAGQTVHPVQVAVKFKIPLIVWGAHQGLDQVGMFSHLDGVEMTRKYRKEHDLMGYEAEDIVDAFDHVTAADIQPFVYPSDLELERIGVRGIYLGNFIRWDSRAQHELMIGAYGFETAKLNRTFDSYNDIDCWVYNDVHDHMKVLKHGFGKVLDHACREIRLRRMTRDEGVQLVRRYADQPMQHLQLFLDWLGITEEAFHYVADQHRNPAIWRRSSDWKWERCSNQLAYIEAAGRKNQALSQICPHTDFTLTEQGYSSEANDRYILIGKGAS